MAEGRRAEEIARTTHRDPLHFRTGRIQLRCVTRLHFDLESLDDWHRRDVEEQLAFSATHARFATLAAEASNADATVKLQATRATDPLRRLLRSHPPQAYVWSGDDQPAGLEAGLYCSLPGVLHQRARHQSYCYPIRYNEQVQAFDPTEARLLYSFVGGITSGLRARLAQLPQVTKGGGEFRISNGPWNAMLDRSGLEIKKGFAESLRRARFILCPKGNGAGSIRLFEALEAGRVPVIISDAYVTPDGVDWNACALRIREKDIGALPIVLRDNLDRWPAMAAAARQAWEQNFSPAVRLDAIAARLKGLRFDVHSGWRFRLLAHVLAAAVRRRAGRLWTEARRRG